MTSRITPAVLRRSVYHRIVLRWTDWDEDAIWTVPQG